MDLKNELSEPSRFVGSMAERRLQESIYESECMRLPEMPSIRSAGAFVQNPTDVRANVNRLLLSRRNAPLDERTLGGPALPAYLRNAVIALGNFDGFHVGHQAVVLHAIALARARGVAAIVGTFDPHPVSYFKRNASPFSLTTLSQRQQLFLSAGVDAVFVFPFDEALACATPGEFVGKCLADLGGVVTGTDFAFGRSRTGTIAALAELGAKQGLSCSAVAPVSADGDVVSSTRIRQALARGDCAAATKLLTRPFSIAAMLRLSTEFEPTKSGTAASIDFGPFVRPKAGFYDVLVCGRDRCSKGVAHVKLSANEPQIDLVELVIHGSSQWTDRELVDVRFIKYIRVL
ncbi:hypothetical protein [uncultured Caballeronia sp.]|uniref:hypothetical protein n=1 Tax=uncultured Caballeronia sp. TaxID=1827198 RepID=UPI0035CB43F4